MDHNKPQAGAAAVPYTLVTPRCDRCRWFASKFRPAESKTFQECRINPPAGGGWFPVVETDDWCSRFMPKPKES